MILADNNSSNTSKGHAGLDLLCWMTEGAFEVGTQSILGNLIDLREQDWTALPPGGDRSIADILEHCGWCKWMYEDYAFGTAAMQGNQPPLIPSGGLRSRPHDELVTWLKEGHQKWLTSVRRLQDDSELERERLANWGEWLPTRTIIRIMIGHDYYHAGEINHLRALLQGNDRWEYD